MTLEELKTRCEAQGFKYAYGKFKNPTEPPFIVVHLQDTENFFADNKVYKKKHIFAEKKKMKMRK